MWTTLRRMKLTREKICFLALSIDHITSAAFKPRAVPAFVKEPEGYSFGASEKYKLYRRALDLRQCFGLSWATGSSDKARDNKAWAQFAEAVPRLLTGGGKPIIDDLRPWILMRGIPLVPENKTALLNVFKAARQAAKQHGTPRIFAGGSLWVRHDGDRFRLVAQEDVRYEVAQVLRNPLLGGGRRGVEAIYSVMQRGMIGVHRADVGEALKREEMLQITAGGNPFGRSMVIKPKVYDRPDHCWQVDITYMPYFDKIRKLNESSHILMIVDHFSKYLWTYKLKSVKNPDADDEGKKPYVATRFRDRGDGNIEAGPASDEWPKRFKRDVIDILTDMTNRGRQPSSIQTDNEFRVPAMETFCRTMGIRHIVSPPYYPKANGAVERANRTIKNMLSSLMHTHGQANWARYLPMVTKAYNAHVHGSTRRTPYEVYFGQQPKLNQIFTAHANAHFEQPMRAPMTKDRFMRRTHSLPYHIENKMEFLYDRYIHGKEERSARHTLQNLYDKADKEHNARATAYDPILNRDYFNGLVGTKGNKTKGVEEVLRAYMPHVDPALHALLWSTREPLQRNDASLHDLIANITRTTDQLDVSQLAPEQYAGALSDVARALRKMFYVYASDVMQFADLFLPPHDSSDAPTGAPNNAPSADGWYADGIRRVRARLVRKLLTTKRIPKGILVPAPSDDRDLINAVRRLERSEADRNAVHPRRPQWVTKAILGDATLVIDDIDRITRTGVAIFSHDVGRDMPVYYPVVGRGVRNVPPALKAYITQPIKRDPKAIDVPTLHSTRALIWQGGFRGPDSLFSAILVLDCIKRQVDIVGMTLTGGQHEEEKHDTDMTQEMDAARRAAQDAVRRTADRMQRVSDAKGLDKQPKYSKQQSIEVGTVVRLSLLTIDKEYRKQFENKFGTNPARDPARIRDHFTAQMFKVVHVDRRIKPGHLRRGDEARWQTATDDATAQTTDRKPYEYKYRVVEWVPKNDVRSGTLNLKSDFRQADADNGVWGAAKDKEFRRHELLVTPQDYVTLSPPLTGLQDVVDDTDELQHALKAVWEQAKRSPTRDGRSIAQKLERVMDDAKDVLQRRHPTTRRLYTEAARNALRDAIKPTTTEGEWLQTALDIAVPQTKAQSWCSCDIDGNAWCVPGDMDRNTQRWRQLEANVSKQCRRKTKQQQKGNKPAAQPRRDDRTTVASAAALRALVVWVDGSWINKRETSGARVQARFHRAHVADVYSEKRTELVDIVIGANTYTVSHTEFKRALHQTAEVRMVGPHHTRVQREAEETTVLPGNYFLYLIERSSGRIDSRLAYGVPEAPFDTPAAFTHPAVLYDLDNPATVDAYRAGLNSHIDISVLDTVLYQMRQKRINESRGCGEHVLGPPTRGTCTVNGCVASTTDEKEDVLYSCTKHDHPEHHHEQYHVCRSCAHTAIDLSRGTLVGRWVEKKWTRKGRDQGNTFRGIVVDVHTTKRDKRAMVHWAEPVTDTVFELLQNGPDVVQKGMHNCTWEKLDAGFRVLDEMPRRQGRVATFTSNVGIVPDPKLVAGGSLWYRRADGTVTAAHPTGRTGVYLVDGRQVLTNNVFNSVE